MPTYEYRCAAGHDFEAFQRMSEAPLTTCPQCGAAAERQLSAGTGLLFKGQGFYITDYRSESYKKAAAAETTKGPEKPAAGAGKSADAAKDKAKPTGGTGGSSKGSAD